MIKTTFRLSCLLVAVAGLAACAGGSTPHSSNASNPTSASSMQNASQALSSHQWQLTGARDAQGKDQPGWLQSGAGPVGLRFQDGNVSISGLCNHMGASYALQGSSIRIAHVVGTMKMCANDTLMRYEQQFGLRLPQAERWQVEQGASPTLTLTFKDGAQWVFQGQPTHEALYGGPGETVFLEVAPQREACSHPLKPSHQCLRVREIGFDASGAKRRVGEWQLFYDEIENYQHQPGVRNVLRLKRYTRQQAPADASRYVYVLDMVVESENTAIGRPR